jgi:exonuclease III
MTMLKPGKMHEIADQMLKTQLQIIALQESRWKGRGQIKEDKYSLYYSCAQQNIGQLGTGFMVKRNNKTKQNNLISTIQREHL